MLTILKDDALTAPFGALEVTFPAPDTWNMPAFQELLTQELAGIRRDHAAYERKALFGENPYFRYFRKFKKTYPVMQQFESFLLKDRPFPAGNPVTAIPFLAELKTQVLMGTHDVECIEGSLTLFRAVDKTPFPGLRGDEAHTYPNDLTGRDDAGIMLSMIAGADARTCARPDSRHVIYPVFGVPGQTKADLLDALDLLDLYVRTLAPHALIEQQLL